MGGQAFCYTFLLYLLFVSRWVRPARVGIPRHESLFSSTGNGSKTLGSVSLFSCWLDWPSPSFLRPTFFTYRVLLPLFLVKLNDEKHILHLHTVIFPGSNLFVFLLVSFVAAGLQISLQTFHLRLVLSGVATTYRYLPTSMIFHLHTEYQQYILQHLCIDD